MNYKIKAYIGNIITYNDYDGEYYHIKEVEKRLCYVVNDSYVIDFNTKQIIKPLDRDENGDIYNLIYANEMYLDCLIQLDEETEEKLLPYCVDNFSEFLKEQEEKEKKSSKILEFRKPLI